MHGGSKLEVIQLHKDQQIELFVLAERQLGGWQLGGGKQGLKPEIELVEFGNSLHLGSSHFVLQPKNFGRIVEIV